MEAFNSELDAFKERITKRAKEKLQKAMEEYEEVEYFTMGTDKSLFYLFMIWIWIMIWMRLILFMIKYFMDKVDPDLKKDLGLYF